MSGEGISPGEPGEEAGELGEEAEELGEEDLRDLDPDQLRRVAESRRKARSPYRKARKSGPREVRELVGGLLEKWGLADQLARAAVFQEWDERMGEKIAERARPVGFDEGTLFVEVASASWLMELQMMKRDLISRVNAGRKRGRVENIVFVQGGGSQRSRNEGDGGRRSRE